MDCKLVASTNRRYYPGHFRKWSPITLVRFAQFSLPDPIICLAGLSADCCLLAGKSSSAPGRASPLLVLLDSYPPGPVPPRDVPDEQEIINEFLRDLGYDPAILGERPLQLSTLKELLRQKESIYSNLEDKYLQHHPKSFRNNVRLAGSFVPERFDGDLLFFAAVEDSPASPADAWRPDVRGQIKFAQTACRHGNMTDPGPIAQIGQALAIELEKTTQQPNQPNQRVSCRTTRLFRELSQNVSASIPIVAWSIRNIADPGF